METPATTPSKHVEAPLTDEPDACVAKVADRLNAVNRNLATNELSVDRVDHDGLAGNGVV